MQQMTILVWILVIWLDIGQIHKGFNLFGHVIGYIGQKINQMRVMVIHLVMCVHFGW